MKLSVRILSFSGLMNQVRKSSRCWVPKPTSIWKANGYSSSGNDQSGSSDLHDVVVVAMVADLSWGSKKRVTCLALKGEKQASLNTTSSTPHGLQFNHCSPIINQRALILAIVSCTHT
jgi:hypothetical protein